MAPLLLVAGALLLQAEPAPPAGEDVVVVGERLRRLKLTTKTDRKTGVQRCIVKRPSGDPAVDATMCDATLACAAKVTNMPEMKACLTPTIKAYVADLRARHRQQALSPPPGER